MENYHELLMSQNEYFSQGNTKDVDHRIKTLQQLKQSIKEQEQELLDSLKQDLNKSEFEAYMTEIGIIYHEISFFIRHLRSWSKPRKVKTPLTHFGSKSYIYTEPYGSVLIIAPWNYPFQLAVSPLIGAIAAGNSVVLKPSELTPNTSNVLARLISDNFPKEHITVVEGGVEVSEALLKENFDYIFFTGSVQVGKIIMQAAAKHLTPVTLELGGKSPVIVDREVSISLAAKRIAWGKYLNAGQTCVAPDYVYVHNEVKQEFLYELKQAVKQLFSNDPLSSEQYTRIVNRRHFDRLSKYLTNGTTYYGGGSDRNTLMIEPTILTDITWQDDVMTEEIFGPILPILEYDDLSQVISIIRSKPNPLALYLFSNNNHVQQLVLNQVSFGGGCINDVIYHLSSPYLPFGGVGSSGMGAYHGKASFDTFSHKKSVMKQTTKFDISMRYPHVKSGLKKIRRFLK